MIQIEREKLEKVLDALKQTNRSDMKEVVEAITAIKDVLAQKDKYSFGIYGAEDLDKAWKSGYDNCKAQRTWVGLTDKDVGQILKRGDVAELDAEKGLWHVLPYSFAQAIEAKLKQKNGFAEKKDDPLQPEENNFCSRCGKRLGKSDWDIHTCTPPQD